MRLAATPRELSAGATRFRTDVRELGITSIEDVEPSRALGDARGESALQMSLNLKGPGYHVYVCGLEGPDRLERVAEWMRPMLRREGALSDWVYVHNFREASRPRAIRLVAGAGRKLQVGLESLLNGLREDLPKAFREEAFESEKAEVAARFETLNGEHRRALEQIAEKAGFAILFTPQGNISLVPMVDGKPIASEEEFRALGPERITELEKARMALANEIRDHVERNLDEHHRMDEEIRRIEREFAGRIVRSRTRVFAEHFENEAVSSHLDELVEHLLDHLAPFRGEIEAPGGPFALFAQERPDPFAIYAVNVVVDNSQTEEAPVLVLDSPTYKNLFGSIDRQVDRLGRVTTDFRQIHAGALLQADGGVVVAQAEDTLIEPFVWRILRRALRSGRVEIEAYDPFVAFTAAAGIRPEPIQVDTKVALVGPRWLFEALLAMDVEFRDLFKVLADFYPVVDRSEGATRALCARIADVWKREKLLSIDSEGLSALVELAVREAGDRRKLKLGSERVLDTAREAGALARAAGRSQVTREEVLAATRARVDRLDRIEEAIREAIARGLVLVDVEGSCVGQVNGLSVSELGGHAFGRPSRISAALGLGSEGVVSIDRETQLSGAIHDKGVLILESFLRDRFARSRPLSLMASVVFEQSYGHVEGDSASLAELVALLSCIGEFELRQDLAVTGSVNQHGEVQAIGGVSEKIEGFFDCCRVNGLSGQQGVVFPASNVEHVILREDVVEAVAAGCFHLHPVETVDEALEILTGLAAGSSFEPDTLNAAVDAALDRFARRLAEFARSGSPG